MKSTEGGCRIVREGAVQAIQIFLALFTVLAMVRGFYSYYHTLKMEQPAVSRSAPPRAAKQVLGAAATIAPKPAEAKPAPSAPPAPAPVAPPAAKPIEAKPAPGAPPAPAPKPADAKPAPGAPAAPAAPPAPAPKPTAGAAPAPAPAAPAAPAPAPADAKKAADPPAAKVADPPAAPAPNAAEAPKATKRHKCPAIKFMQEHPLSTYRLPMFILVLLVGARIILSLRTFDRLYTEGAVSPVRGFTGLLIHLGFLVAQISLLAFMAAALESEESSDPAAFFFVGFLLISGVWYLWTRLTAGSLDGPAFRYALPAAINDLAIAAVIFGGLFIYAGMKSKHGGATYTSPITVAAFLGIVNVYINYLIAVRTPDDPALVEAHVLRSWLAIGMGVIICCLIVASIILAEKLPHLIVL
jgi:hypothetical protein